jgi:hypothetical protein
MTSIEALPTLLGRLGSPNLQLKDDQRADPRMLQAMAPLRLDVAPEPAPVDATSPGAAILEFCTAAEASYGGAFKALFADLPPVEGVTSSTETIRGVDGNAITLYMHRPAEVDATAPRSPVIRPSITHLERAVVGSLISRRALQLRRSGVSMSGTDHSGQAC